MLPPHSPLFSHPPNSHILYAAPFELSAPTYVLRSALVGSSIYYLTVHFLRALTGAEGLGLVLVAFLTHTLTDDLLGSAYDYTGPVIDVFTTVTLITLPAAGARQPRAAAAAKPSTPRSTSRGRTPRRTRKSD